MSVESILWEQGYQVTRSRLSHVCKSEIVTPRIAAENRLKKGKKRNIVPNQ